MMRWKILELAGKRLSLDEILSELQAHDKFGLSKQEALDILQLYKDTLSDDLRSELNEIS